VSLLVERLLAVHDALDSARLPHAFGGAIALAYCTQEPRGTRDIDVNIFLDSTEAARVTACLPEQVTVGPADIAAIARDGQVRLWWDDTPLDLFFDVHDFHHGVAAGVREVSLSGRRIPVLGCEALAVFKLLFDRTKDWADIEAMLDAGALDRTEVAGNAVRLLGADHHAVRRLLPLLD
jgi:hypothetical protein